MGIKNSTNTLDKVTKNQNSFLVFGAFVSIFAICLFYYICSNIRLINIDDVMYANWTQHGIQYFFEQVWWHINNFNGRTLIHVLLSLTLIFKQYLYSIIIPLCIYFSAFFIYSVIDNDAKLYKKMIISSLTLFFFLSLHELFLSTTLLWMSGGYNYIVPIFFVSLAYYIFYKSRNNNKYSILSFIFCFIAGATTEQYGMFIIGLLTITLFFDIIAKEKQFLKLSIISIIFATLGLMTILLSPGTSVRVDRELSSLVQFYNCFLNNNLFLFGYQQFYFMWMAIIIGFAVLGFNKKYRFMLFGVPFAIIITLLYLLQKNIFIGPVFFVYICVLCILLLRNKELREFGKLMVCGYGTFFMMSMTFANGFRICVPFLLTVIIALISCYFKCCFNENIVQKKFAIPFICCLLVSSFSLGNFAVHVHENKIMHSEPIYNTLNNVNVTKEVVLNFDNMLLECEWSNYRHATVIDTGLVSDMKYAYEYYEFSKTTPVHHVSDKLDVADVTINGQYYVFPVIIKDDSVLVPHTILSYVDGFKRMQFGGLTQIAPDGSICDGFVTNDNTSIAFSNTCNLARIENQKIVYQKNDALHSVYATKAFSIYFINIEDFCEWAELSYEYDSNKNTYHFKTNNRQEN